MLSLPTHPTVSHTALCTEGKLKSKFKGVHWRGDLSITWVMGPDNLQSPFHFQIMILQPHQNGQLAS